MCRALFIRGIGGCMAYQIYCEMNNAAIGYRHFWENVLSRDQRNDILNSLKNNPSTCLLQWRKVYKYTFGIWHSVDLNEKGE